MTAQIDYNDPRYAHAAAAVSRRRHDNGEPEANITSAVRDFLILTGLASGEEMVDENPPAQGSRRAVDLTALDTFIEFKRRIGAAGGFNPNAEYVQQLDDYLEQSEKQGRIRMGILTDGKRWLLRWPNAGPVRTALAYAPSRWRTPTAGSHSSSGSATMLSPPLTVDVPGRETAHLGGARVRRRSVKWRTWSTSGGRPGTGSLLPRSVWA